MSFRARATASALRSTPTTHPVGPTRSARRLRRPRPAADLDDALAAGYRYLIKQPARFMRELLRLLLQPLLLRLPVAKNVLVGLGHDESSHRSRAAELTVDRGAEGHAGGEHEPCRPAVAL